MKQRTRQSGGQRFVWIEEGELRRLRRLAAQATAADSVIDGLPPLPAADAQGNRPAIDFARASIAREIVRDRRAAGLTQQELARRAGVRQETISRLESGKHSPTVRTVEKIDAVLQEALRRSSKKSASKRTKTADGRK
jgi:DNA-binding XRE family transcriptional regulator